MNLCITLTYTARWRHQMETFSALLAICAGNSTVPGEFPTQRPVTQSFDVFLDLRLNKRLSKQWWGWWFETPSCPLWRHCNLGCLLWVQIYIHILSVTAVMWTMSWYIGRVITAPPDCIYIYISWMLFFAIYGAIFYCVWQEHISTNLKLTQKKIGGNVIENVNKMAALLFRPLSTIAEQYSISLSWWRHDIKALHPLLTLFKGIPMWQVTGDYLPKGTVMRNCDVVFVMDEDKLLNSRVAGD